MPEPSDGRTGSGRAAVESVGMAARTGPGCHSTKRRYLVAGLLCLVVVFGVAWIAGRQSMTGAPAGPKSWDAVRLGPESGQPVAEYLAALPARLPESGSPSVPALVQFATGLDVDTAAATLADAPVGSGAGTAAGSSGAPTGARTAARPVTAVFRVPLPRVQTALRFQPLPAVTDSDPAAGLRRRLTLAQSAAQRAAVADAARLRGRSSEVAAAESAALGRSDCRCLLAVLVSGERTALEAVAARPGVRAVDAAPSGTPDDGVALAPLLPEQTRIAGPIPDDGPVPPP